MTNRIVATNNILDEWENVVVPKGTILERQEGVYVGRNSLTGTKISMDASWANDEVYMEWFEEVKE